MTTGPRTHDPATAKPPDWDEGISRTRSVVIAAGAAALGPLVWGGYWWTHPDVFEDSGGAWRSGRVQVANAEFHVGVTMPLGPDSGSRVTFRGEPTAHLTEGGAESEVEFWICRPEPGSDVVGMVGGDLSNYCSSHAPVRDGASLALSGESDGPDTVAVDVTLRAH